MIPGLGTSVRPPMLDESLVDEVVMVEEADTIRACHRLARRGFLFGGSSGTVVSGAMGWLAQHDGQDLTAVAIAPDFGERYLDTLYQTNWLQDLYGEDVLSDFDVPEPGRSPDRLLIRELVTGRGPRNRKDDSQRQFSPRCSCWRDEDRAGSPQQLISSTALGADSLVMAKLPARVRKAEGLPVFV